MYAERKAGYFEEVSMEVGRELQYSVSLGFI
jgi:hypothetical protein